MKVTYKKLYGQEIEQYLNEIAQLRIEVFKEYPYIYDGDLDYEKNYLDRYMNSKLGLIALAYIDEILIGATTCLPLKDEVDSLKAPFIKSSQDINSIFYFGESMIRRKFRGNRVGHEFFRIREEHAQKTMPELKFTSFCAVVRPENHPLKPESYRPLYAFWSRLGYEKDENLIANFSWKDIDKNEEDEKSLMFWKKKWN